MQNGKGDGAGETEISMQFLTFTGKGRKKGGRRREGGSGKRRKGEKG